jgi:hypothetical protein
LPRDENPDHESIAIAEQVIVSQKASELVQQNEGAVARVVVLSTGGVKEVKRETVGVRVSHINRSKQVSRLAGNNLEIRIKIQFISILLLLLAVVLVDLFASLMSFVLAEYVRIVIE